MASLEQIAHQSFELHAPDAKAGGGFGGATRPEHPQQGHLSEDILSEAEPLISDIQLDTVQSETNPQAIVGRASGTPLGSKRPSRFTLHWKSREEMEEYNRQAIEFTKNQPSGIVIWGNPDLKWSEVLSPKGQLMYRLLLGGQGIREWLEDWSREYNFDLNKTLTELRNHGLLDESNPKRIILISKGIGNK